MANQPKIIVDDLTDREVALLMTLCKLLGNKEVNEREIRRNHLQSVQEMNREHREQYDLDSGNLGQDRTS